MPSSGLQAYTHRENIVYVINKYFLKIKGKYEFHPNSYSSLLSKYKIPVVTEYEDIDIFIYENCKADYEIVLIKSNSTNSMPDLIKANWKDSSKYKLSRFNQGIFNSDTISNGYCSHHFGIFKDMHTWTCNKPFKIKTFKKSEGIYSIAFEY